MASFAKEMSFYTAYHQQSTNVWIHVFGVPLITFSAFIPLHWLELFQLGALPCTAALLLYAYSLQYYLRSDLMLGGIAGVLYGLLLYLAWQIAQLETSVALGVFAAVQIIAWAAQIFGHAHYENNKPAFMENLHQAFISAPLFVVADVLFHFGFRPELQQAIKDELKQTNQLRSDSVLTSDTLAQ